MHNWLDEATIHCSNDKIEFQNTYNTNPMTSHQIWFSTPFPTKRFNQCHPWFKKNHLCTILVSLSFHYNGCNTYCH